MRTASQARRPNNLLRWFDPRQREIGTWAFILNRVTALGLTLYLFLHLIVLSLLARGAEGYDGFIQVVKNPVFLFGEFLVVMAGLIHGLNGIRIIMTSFGIGNARQKGIFFTLMAIAATLSLIFAVRMFGGE